MFAYTSVYGHTKAAVNQFVEKLKSKGCPKVVVYDLARDDMSQALQRCVPLQQTGACNNHLQCRNLPIYE